MSLHYIDSNPYLSAVGDISERYMGAIPALSPELIPMMKRPRMRRRYVSAYLAAIRHTPATAIRMLFSSRPPLEQRKY